MMDVFKILLGVYSFSAFTRAMIVIKYQRTTAPLTSDVLECGDEADPIHYCAARVTNDTCEPLTKDWCETRNMSLGGSYLSKRTVEYVLEDTFKTRYRRRLPTYFPVGSVIEMEFMPRTNWTGFRCNLMDVNETVVLHTIVYSDSITTCWKQYGTGACINRTTTLEPHTYNADTRYVLGIRLDTNSFHIYMDGEHVWTYNPILPVSSVVDVRTFFRNVKGDLFRVTFKIGL